LKNTKENKKDRTERLKAIRLLLGYTQKQFAEKLEMSREGYQKLERGENNISMEVLEKLKTVYGISADYLLYGDFQDGEQIWNRLKNCSENTKLEIMIRLISYFTASRKIIFSESEFDLETFLREIASQDNRNP